MAPWKQVCLARPQPHVGRTWAGSLQHLWLPFSSPWGTRPPLRSSAPASHLLTFSTPLPPATVRAVPWALRKPRRVNSGVHSCACAVSPSPRPTPRGFLAFLGRLGCCFSPSCGFLLDPLDPLPVSDDLSALDQQARRPCP